MADHHLPTSTYRLQLHSGFGFAAAAEQVSRNVQAVAAGAEQMGASIREIAQNTVVSGSPAQRMGQVTALLAQL